MSERWFTEDELSEMSRPTMDRAIEAIDRGDGEEAKRLCESMKHESQFMHDMLVDGTAGLISFIKEKLGDEGVSVEVLDLRTLIPWDREAVLSSVERCSKVLVLHEDTKTGGFGAEIAATIAEEAFEDLDGPVKRIAAPDTPVPFSPPLEKAFIPQVDDVAAGLRELAED